ncbi:hypothetical protein [Candidatus Enterococcus mansonii]|uniref:Lipoprotein n=1 Tax=Candidatus Enterococcus mansonii TaxID=1834181 RepID=A0A242CG34_9ENTE|nr:hypothetical protein [Enterococcus sp. 4G2_DIV0659]OTO08742.1 hypothetical protein A5880_001742 [Enterococcus sp. 4G2_DIV0659]
MEKYLKLTLLLGIAFLLVGCSKEKSTATVDLPKEDAAFTWWADRNRNFGTSNYPVELSEINKIMEDKYQIEFTPLIAQSNAIITKEFSGENKNITNFFELKAKGESLLFAGNTLFEDQQKNIVTRIKTVVEYNYMADLQKVKLANQEVEIRTVIKDKKYQGNDFDSFIKQVIKMMELPDSDKVFELFEKKLNGNKEAIAGQTIKLYDSREEGAQERTFSKYLLVQFDGDAIPMNIFLGTTDYRY